MNRKNTKRIYAVANGLGSQSMYLLVLAAKKIIPATVSITADTGAEFDCLWNTGERTTAREYFDRVVEPYCNTHGIIARFVRAVTADGSERTGLLDHVRLIGGGGKAPAIPLYGSQGGQLRQGCTSKWKVAAIQQEARRLGAKHFRSAQGIHLGEAARRMKGKYIGDEGGWSIYQDTVRTKDGERIVKWCSHFYPLVDLRLRRNDTRRLLAGEGIPFLESSECDMCPHKDLARWERTSPETLVDMAAIERSFGGEYFLTSERIPLMDAIERMKAAKRSVEDLDFGCGNAYCGI